jgi:hypothetical protein
MFVQITIVRRPAYFKNKLASFVFQALDNLTVKAEKVDGVFKVKKEDMVSSLKQRGYGFVHAGEHIDSMKDVESITLLKDEVEEVK